MQTKIKLRKLSFIKLIIVAIMLIGFTSCGESWDRAVKDIKSDYGGGLHRKVTVYDYNGNAIQSWEGYFDTQMGDSSGQPFVKFDIPNSNGRKIRVMIQGGIIINEEI